MKRNCSLVVGTVRTESEAETLLEKAYAIAPEGSKVEMVVVQTWTIRINGLTYSECRSIL